MNRKNLLKVTATALTTIIVSFVGPVLAQTAEQTPVPTEQDPSGGVSGASPQSPVAGGEAGAEAAMAQPDAPVSASPAADASLQQLDTIPVPSAQASIPPVTSGARDDNGIVTVIVTARRVAENQQDVPVAISAFSSEDLAREQINSPTDLNGRVPSLAITPNSQMRNTESPTIRGQGAQYGSAPGVVTYYAEAPLPTDTVSASQGGPGKFFDLSNLQILKGSQGTLFGRNTTGGALLLEPHKPDEFFGGSLKAEGTSLDGRTYEGVINLPIIDQTLLMRAGAQYVDRDGFTHDVATGKDYDNKHYWTSRLGITWRPADAVNNYLLGYYTRSRDNGTATVIRDINRTGLNQLVPYTLGIGGLLELIPGLPLTQAVPTGCVLLNVFGPSTNCGQDILDEQRARGPRHVQLSADPNDFITTAGAIDQFSFDLTDNLTLRNIASYAAYKHHYRWDLDGSRAGFIEFDSPDNLDQAVVHTVTEELQLQGHALDGSLMYTVGGYYERSPSHGEYNNSALFFEKVYGSYDVVKESWAPFVQGTYDFGNLSESLTGLQITLGGRYTHDKTDSNVIFLQQLLVQGGVPLTDVEFDQPVNDSAPTYTVGLDYKFGDNLVYGKVSRGYRTGGVSYNVVNPDHRAFDPEFVTNYEIGQKSDFKLGGIPVRINTAAYYTDYTDLQISGTDSYVDPSKPSVIPALGGAIFNVGKAAIAGFEFDGMIVPARGLFINLTYGYTWAKYKDFEVSFGGATPQRDCTGEEKTRGSTLQLECVPYQLAPKHQTSIGVRYLLPLDYAIGDVEASATYSWTARKYSAQTTTPNEEPGAWLPSVGLLSANVRWSDIFRTHFSVAVFGTNLTNKLYRISNSNQWSLTYIDSAIYSEPRIVGVSLDYRWGE